MSDPSVEPPAQEFYAFELWVEMAGEAFDAGGLAVELVLWPFSGVGLDVPRSLTLRVSQRGQYVVILPSSGDKIRDQRLVLDWAREAINRRLVRDRQLAAEKPEAPLVRQIARLLIGWASR